MRVLFDLSVSGFYMVIISCVFGGLEAEARGGAGLVFFRQDGLMSFVP